MTLVLHIENIAAQFVVQPEPHKAKSRTSFSKITYFVQQSAFLLKSDVYVEVVWHSRRRFRMILTTTRMFLVGVTLRVS